MRSWKLNCFLRWKIGKIKNAIISSFCSYGIYCARITYYQWQTPWTVYILYTSYYNKRCFQYWCGQDILVKWGIKPKFIAFLPEYATKIDCKIDCNIISFKITICCWLNNVSTISGTCNEPDIFSLILIIWLQTREQIRFAPKGIF